MQSYTRERGLVLCGRRPLGALTSCKPSKKSAFRPDEYDLLALAQLLRTNLIAAVWAPSCERSLAPCRNQSIPTRLGDPHQLGAFLTPFDHLAADEAHVLGIV